MNHGDKVLVLHGPYKGYIGELVEYKQQTIYATPYCRVQIPGFSFELAIDPWDIEKVEETNEADATSASNL